MRIRGFAPRGVAGLMLAALSHLHLYSQTTVTFEELPLSGPNSYWNGADRSGGFTSRGIRFHNDYNADWGSWSGVAYSNVDDATTPGYLNQYAVVSGTGLGNTGNYAVAYDAGNAAVVALPQPTRVLGVYLNNTTYTALTMRDGDAFTERFGGQDGNEPDWYRLTVTGKDTGNRTTGAVDFYLADYRFEDPGEDYIVTRWAFADLTSLGSEVSQVEFSLTSSDVGEFGMNTPAYFAMDSLSVLTVPEPATSTFWLLGGAALIRRPRARKNDSPANTVPGGAAPDAPETASGREPGGRART